MPVFLDPRGAGAQTWPWGVRRAVRRRIVHYQCAANRRLPASPGTGYTLEELQSLMRWDNSRGVRRL
jgi:hypothetical protein